MTKRRPVVLGMMARAFIKRGNPEKAREILKELDTEPMNNDKLYAIAIIKNSLGQLDDAFNIFYKLADEKYGIMVYMKAEQDLFKETNDPRYYDILKKLGFQDR